MNDTKPPSVPCLLETWKQTEASLYRWLTHRCLCDDLAFDLLQETFLKALQRDKSFCDIENQKAWLFTVAKNLLVDEWRKSERIDVLDNEEYHAIHDDTPLDRDPVDSLAQCLPKALACLNNDDRAILEYCDLQGHSQLDFAKRNHLSLSAVKSRIQRARPRLRSQLKNNCHIRFDLNNKVCCFTPSDDS